MVTSFNISKKLPNKSFKDEARNERQEFNWIVSYCIRNNRTVLSPNIKIQSFLAFPKFTPAIRNIRYLHFTC